MTELIPAQTSAPADPTLEERREKVRAQLEEIRAQVEAEFGIVVPEPRFEESSAEQSEPTVASRPGVHRRSRLHKVKALVTR